MNDVFYAHSPPPSLSRPFCPLLSIVRASPPQLAPPDSSPWLLPSSPALSLQSRLLQPHSIRPMQFAQEKNAIICLITPVGDLALVGWVGMGRRSTPVAESTGLEVPVSRERPTHSLGLHSGAKRVQSLGLPNSSHRDLETKAWNDWVHSCPWRVPGPFHVSVSLSDNESGVGGSL